MTSVLIVGGTGPHGRGLARRLATAGATVVVGSRSRARADEAAAWVRSVVPNARVTGTENTAGLADASRVILAMPCGGLLEFVEGAHDLLADRLIIDTMVPVRVRDGVGELLPVQNAGSVGELVQRLVPSARVVSTLKNVAAKSLGDDDAPVEGDVVLCGNDAAARAEVAAIVRSIPHLVPVDGGDIRGARYLEALTALQITLNIRHRAHTSVRFPGLPR